ncbi:hypothetical protein [Brumimicrobium aurantiacum]|uniref:Uncharacterized protein n=1 Tax=Brumimicrobium aurantiacum TaxID=1737063 RepID=A0A3E1EY13_9FLAO|nr:hypothetical protein [Brumimicrobium aurantiacum]RFC54353.1 hypothetical protein DXU93_07965 [Brumimicrobium aurantiacum]
MKKLIILFAMAFLTSLGFAQTATVEGTAANLKENLAEDFIEFTMPSEVTTEDVEKSSQYYTDYFNVSFDDNTNLARIDLVNQDQQAKRVITRFLLSTGVRTVNFEGTDYTIMEFYSNFLE